MRADRPQAKRVPGSATEPQRASTGSGSDSSRATDKAVSPAGFGMAGIGIGSVWEVGNAEARYDGQTDVEEQVRGLRRVGG